MMNQEVVSSNIKQVGWQDGSLYIKFNSGVSYVYENVPLPTYQGLAGAGSTGQYFHHHVKGKFSYTALGTDPFTPVMRNSDRRAADRRGARA